MWPMAVEGEVAFELNTGGASWWKVSSCGEVFRHFAPFSDVFVVAWKASGEVSLPAAAAV